MCFDDVTTSHMLWAVQSLYTACLLPIQIFLHAIWTRNPVLEIANVIGWGTDTSNLPTVNIYKNTTVHTIVTTIYTNIYNTLYKSHKYSGTYPPTSETKPKHIAETDRQMLQHTKHKKANVSQTVMNKSFQWRTYYTFSCVKAWSRSLEFCVLHQADPLKLLVNSLQNADKCEKKVYLPQKEQD